MPKTHLGPQGPRWLSPTPFIHWTVVVAVFTLINAVSTTAASAQQQTGRDAGAGVGPVTRSDIAMPAAVTATRLEQDAPVVDGRLDDEAWSRAFPHRHFLQRDPEEGATPSESTVVRFVYTDHDLYVAFRGYDSEPDRVYGRLVRRDQRTAADYFSLFIDSYHDRRTAYEFSINPSGARRDVFIFDDGNGRDESWDPVYDWSARRDSLGWTVEMRIPFSQLRFPRQDSIVFGVRIRRSINRRNEEVNWPFVPRDQAGEVSHYGQLVGLVGVPRPRRLELLPYTAASATFEPSEPNNPFLATGRTSAMRAGTDLKLGITGGLTLDLTVNPDFGQVEADAAEVNLSAFETFFPEKRPFFVEGSNLFQFGLQPSQRRQFGFGGGGREGLVYTRRVGRSPQVRPDEQGGYADRVGETSILGAGKMSGQLGNGWSLGVAQALTAKEYAAVVDSLGADTRSPVEPLTSYTVARIQRSLQRGRLAYGAIATSVARRLDESSFDELHRRAFSGGADLSARFGQDQYEVDVAVMGSRVEGSVDAITNTQERSARYFQRPDKDYAVLDTTRTALSGFAGYAQVAKVVGFLTWQLRYATRSPGFETNDLGFLSRADVHQQRAEVELRWLTPGRVFRQFEWQVQQEAEFTYGWERTRTSVETQLSGDFLNYWNLRATAERRFPSTDVRLLRGGPAVLAPGAWDLRLSSRTDFRRPLWANLSVSHSLEDQSGARSWRVNGGVRLRPPGRFSLSLDASGRVSTEDRQYVTRASVADSTFYVLGRLDRREVSMTLRADLAITPRLSLELYAQPLVSAGTYDPLRLASSPRAARYQDRLDDLGADRISRPGGDDDVEVDVDRDGTVDFAFSDPDFRIVSLRTNAVLRWEFRPGSTLFLVWQQNRRDRIRNGDLEFGDALTDAFTAAGTQVLAVKIAYWLGT